MNAAEQQAALDLRGMHSKIVVSQHVQDASRARILELLLDVTTWRRLPNDPKDWKRNEEAQRLYDLITAEPARLEEGRHFLGGLKEYAEADNWV